MINAKPHEPLQFTSSHCEGVTQNAHDDNELKSQEWKIIEIQFGFMKEQILKQERII